MGWGQCREERTFLFLIYSSECSNLDYCTRLNLILSAAAKVWHHFHNQETKNWCKRKTERQKEVYKTRSCWVEMAVTETVNKTLFDTRGGDLFLFHFFQFFSMALGAKFFASAAVDYKIETKKNDLIRRIESLRRNLRVLGFARKDTICDKINFWKLVW